MKEKLYILNPLEASNNIRGFIQGHPESSDDNMARLRDSLGEEVFNSICMKSGSFKHNLWKWADEQQIPWRISN